MNDFDEIITNESYKNLFEQNRGFHKDQYPTSQSEEYDALDNNGLTKALAVLFQKRDFDRQALYGIEIKSNGSSRSGRIPLVRVSGRESSIWKVSSKVEDLQKTVTALNELVYFLEKHNDQGYLIPLKVIILRGNENYYATQNSPHYKFVNDLIGKSGAILFSLQFIKNLLAGSNHVNLNSYLQTGKIFTTTPSI